MTPFILAQIFGLLGACSMLISGWQKTRGKVLTFLIFDSVFYFIQYLILGALTGALINIISVIRTILFKNKEKYKRLQDKVTLLIIITLYTLVGVITYDGIISMFPVASSILYAIVLWQNNVKTIRIGSSIMILSCLIYNITVSAYLSAVVEAVLLISTITAVVKLDIRAKKLTNN